MMMYEKEKKNEDDGDDEEDGSPAHTITASPTSIRSKTLDRIEALDNNKVFVPFMSVTSLSQSGH